MASSYGDLEVIDILAVGGADPISVFKPNQGQDGEIDFIDPFKNKLMIIQVRESLLSLRE
jgi:hypothetical protein